MSYPRSNRILLVTVLVSFLLIVNEVQASSSRVEIRHGLTSLMTIKSKMERLGGVVFFHARYDLCVTIPPALLRTERIPEVPIQFVKIGSSFCKLPASKKILAVLDLVFSPASYQS